MKRVILFLPSFAVLAFAKEDNTVRLVLISSTKSSAFLNAVSIIQHVADNLSHFSSRYSSPKQTKAVSYSRTAASEVTEGGLEMISLNCASAFLGSVFANFCASTTRAESAGAIVYCYGIVSVYEGFAFEGKSWIGTKLQRGSR